jgi:hypothetical protein
MNVNFLAVYTKADGITRAQDQTANIPIQQAMTMLDALLSDKTITLISFGANILPAKPEAVDNPAPVPQPGAPSREFAKKK